MSTINLALDLVIALLSRASEVSAAIKKAQAEGRDLTDAELDSFVAANDEARAALVEAIARAKP